MTINPFIFRMYDIRGIVDEDLDAAKVEAIGRAYGTLLRGRDIKTAVAGRDCRLSGEEYQTAFMKGLASTGVDIINVGQVMTQMVYYGQYRFQTKGAVMVTASHNPSNFNGFKLGIDYSLTTGPNEVREIKRTIENESYFVAEEPGKIIGDSLAEDYYNDLFSRIKFDKKFKIVVDYRHGTPGMYVPEILKRAGCEVINIKSNPDGSFPAGTPDPTDRRFISGLANIVMEEKADLGLAFDADGDRIGTVDERGNILWNDVLVAIFAQEILGKKPGAKIIYNTLCSQVVPWVINKNGGQPIMWRTGHSFIKAKMAEEKAAYGGELSGHFFFSDDAYGYDDGSYAALRLLRYLANQNLSLSQLYESFPKYISSPEIKIGCPDDKKTQVIQDLSQRFKADFPEAKITDDTIIPGDDGTRADFEDGMMIFRYSQNGPYITVKFEAKDQETYEKRKKYTKKILESYPEMIWQDQLCVNLDSLD